MNVITISELIELLQKRLESDGDIPVAVRGANTELFFHDPLDERDFRVCDGGCSDRNELCGRQYLVIS